MNFLEDFYRNAVLFLISKFEVKNGDFKRYKNFRYWQKAGVNILPNHYYQPIPDISDLQEGVFNNKSEMVGLQMSPKKQLLMLRKFRKLKKEYDLFKKLPFGINDQVDPNYYFENLAFDGVDGLIYYCMIRLLKPGKILEVGSGWSTKIAAKAALLNKNTELICVEPFPQPILSNGFPGLTKVIKKKVQKISLNIFLQLKAGDILFIDSSHTVKTGGDVNYLFLEVIPRLKKGVYVHIHDIFLPKEYPREWLIKENRFWNEQYLLWAFLLFNDTFEVVYSNSYMGENYASEVKKAFTNSPFYTGGSIWIKKIK